MSTWAFVPPSARGPVNNAPSEGIGRSVWFLSQGCPFWTLGKRIDRPVQGLSKRGSCWDPSYLKFVDFPAIRPKKTRLFKHMIYNTWYMASGASQRAHRLLCQGLCFQKTILCIDFGTRVLKTGADGPSGDGSTQYLYGGYTFLISL